MGKIDDAVPFFGRGFNKIYPLIMVMYTLLVVSNFFDKVICNFGSWNKFRFQSNADGMDGFDPSGMIILQKEIYWVEKGHEVGEQVIPLARNFNNASMDHVEASTHIKGGNALELKNGASSIDTTGGKLSEPSKDETRKFSRSGDSISHKYTIIREQSRQSTSSSSPAKTNMVTRICLTMYAYTYKSY